MGLAPIALSDIAAVDLTAYGLDNMRFDGDGDGNIDTTALRLIIYAHENLYGGSWDDVEFDVLPGSSYFKSGVFGFTENLVYFHNGDFHFFADAEGNFLHDYTTEAGSALNVKLMHSFCDLMFGQSWLKEAADYEIFYGTNAAKVNLSGALHKSKSTDNSRLIVALTMWGINPDTDARFIKNGKSTVDNLLSYYIEEEGFSTV